MSDPNLSVGSPEDLAHEQQIREHEELIEAMEPAIWTDEREQVLQEAKAACERIQAEVRADIKAGIEALNARIEALKAREAELEAKIRTLEADK